MTSLLRAAPISRARVKVCACFVSLAFALLLCAADPTVRSGLESIRAVDLRADLTFLASPALEGRQSLHRGSEVAIQFIAAEFAKAGLKPLAGDSFLQPVPLFEFRVDESRTTIVTERAGSTHTYHYGADFVGDWPADVDVRAGVAFAGYGITAPEFGYDDYAGLDAHGKIVLVFDHEPQENDPRSIFNGTGNTRYSSTGVKQLNAQKHGAVGMLVASEPNRKHPSNRERRGRIPGGELRQKYLLPQALTDSPAQIPMLDVSDTLAADLLAASGSKPSELQSQIDRSLKPASLPLAAATAEIHVEVSERRRGESANVLGMMEGSDPQLRNETVIFSSHYDHNGNLSGQIFPGADDNGSGTVGVLELARAFGKNTAASAGGRPKRTVVFAVFAAEERGLLGSYYYAAHPLRPLQTTRAIINFDMIGRNETPSRQTEGLIEIGPDTSNELNLIGVINSPDYRRTVEQANRDVGLNLNDKWDRDAALNIFQRSDQFPFALHNIPAVWWFTGFHPDYHQTTDTVEKIDFQKMEKIVRLAYLTGWAFAADAPPPRFVTNPVGGVR